MLFGIRSALNKHFHGHYHRRQFPSLSFLPSIYELKKPKPSISANVFCTESAATGTGVQLLKEVKSACQNIVQHAQTSL